MQLADFLPGYCRDYYRVRYHHFSDTHSFVCQPAHGLAEKVELNYRLPSRVVHGSVLCHAHDPD